MKTLRLAACLLLLASAAHARDYKRDARWLYLGPAAALGIIVAILPLMHAHESLEPVGFHQFPYGNSEGNETELGEPADYASGQKPWSMALRASQQLTEGKRNAIHAGVAMRTQNRLGVDFNWSEYEEGALKSTKSSSYWNAHVTGNLAENPDHIAEWGIGMAGLDGRDNRLGGSFSLNIEWFPARPASLNARYQLGMLTDERAYHALSLEIGAVWRWLGVGAGYRAFLNPHRNSYGPEGSVRIWF